MSAKNIIRQIGNIVLPTVLFYAVYSLAGIVPAMSLSLLFSAANAVFTHHKEKRIPNTQLFGLIGSALSTVGVLFTDNEKLYYVPALVGNCVFFLFALGLTLRNKSILHYVARDFKIKRLEQTGEANLFSVNIVWLVFFLLKILSKALGILFLGFDELYWLVFLLGDPMMILVVVYSVYRVGRVMRSAAKPTETEN